MKTLLPFLTAIAAFLVQSCSGNVDEDLSGLYLEADKTEILADGADKVNFKVTLGGVDVTGEAAIQCLTDGSAVESASFCTMVPGTYEFQASYNGEESRVVTVSAGSSASGDSEFIRNYCIAELTEAYCINCPDGAGYLLGYFCREIVGFDNACVLAFHGNSLGEDPLAIPAAAEIMAAYSLTNLPSYVFDMRVAGDLMNERGKLQSAYEESRDSYPAICGLAVMTEYDEASGTAGVTVSLKSSARSSFRLALLVVEDHVSSVQLTNTEGTKPDYDHRHVVRRILSPDYRGESLGELSAGQEISREFTVKIEEGWNPENISICAIAYDSAGYVNNCRSCALGNAADYQYK